MSEKTRPLTPDSVKLNREIKEIFAEWCKSSTSHGVPNIARAKTTAIRIMWAIFCLASVGYCSYTIVNGFMNYLKYEVVTQIDLEMQSPTEFPAVTICNLNPFNKMRSRDSMIKYLVQNNMSQQMNMAQNGTSLGDKNAFEILKMVTKVLKSSIAADKNLTLQDRKDLGFQLESDMLISCSFNGNSCNETDFLWTLSYDFGNCYTFNSGYDSTGKIKKDIFTTTQYGQNNGLHLEILVGNPNTQVDYVYKSGLFVLVHNQSFYPVQLDSGINVATGFETNIAISREFRYKLDGYYSDCIKLTSDPSTFDSKLYKEFFSSLNFTTYNRAFCLKMCYQEQVIQRCGCSDVSLPTLNQTAEKCHTKDELICVIMTTNWFGVQDLETLCLPSCPLECDSVTYQLKSNIANYPTNYYTNLLKLQTNLNRNFPMDKPDTSVFIKESILKVTLNYDDNTHKITNEVPAIDFGGFLANIGGQLGLFIGISILSLIEIVELALEVIQLLIVRKFKSYQTKIQAFE